MDFLSPFPNSNFPLIANLVAGCSEDMGRPVFKI